MDQSADLVKGKIITSAMKDAECRRQDHRFFYPAFVFGFCFRLYAVLFSLAVMLAGSQFSSAESLASKNKRGNRLFEQGKYENAEKAYLAAQGDEQGKPEILYNLGNSLIKQKKYQEGVQALGQSIKKGDKGIKERGWYNTGNALFSAGNYKDSADAFIQALKLDPGDKDAKFNLELALMNLEKPKQKDSRNQSSSGKQPQPQPSNQDKNSAGNPKENAQAKPRASQAFQGSITKDQAIQLLDAVKNQELKEQRKLLETRSAEKAHGRDW
jgi:Ca-activated chloride channel family protein